MEQIKCLHVPCTCLVKPEDVYCAEECREADLEAGAVGHNEFHCSCHHPDCEGVAQTVSPILEGLSVASEALAAV